MGEVGSALTSAKAILVTGGAGYIGAHVCEALAAAGYRPVTYDNLSTGRRRFVRWGPLVEGDVWDADKVRHTLIAHDICAVMHFAGSSVVSESVRAPLDYYRNNVGGLFGLLGGMRAAGVNKLVFSSTCAVYGDPGSDPITEATPLAPVTPYGRSKLSCEQILSDASAAHGLNVIALRYFNASGASASGLIGEDRPVETHLIPRAMMALRGQIDDFAVHGTDYPTPDGTAVRDYVHVCDLAQGHLAALTQLLGDRRGFFACNLGAGRGHSVQQVLDAIANHSGLRLPDAAGGRRAGDPAAPGVGHRPGAPGAGLCAAPFGPGLHRRQRLGVAQPAQRNSGIRRRSEAFSFSNFCPADLGLTRRRSSSPAPHSAWTGASRCGWRSC